MDRFCWKVRIISQAKNIELTFDAFFVDVKFFVWKIFFFLLFQHSILPNFEVTVVWGFYYTKKAKSCSRNSWKHWGLYFWNSVFLFQCKKNGSKIVFAMCNSCSQKTYGYRFGSRNGRRRKSRGHFRIPKSDVENIFSQSFVWLR